MLLCHRVTIAYKHIVILFAVIDKSMFNLSKFLIHRKVPNISRTETQTLNDSRLVLQLSLPNTLKSGVKSRMEM